MPPISDAAIEALTATAIGRGFITHAQLSALLRGAEHQSAKIDALCILLQDLTIRVVPEPPVQETSTLELEPEPETLKPDLTPPPLH